VTLDLRKFKELLLQKRAMVRKDLEAGTEASRIVELDQTRVGRISRMDALQAQAMSQATNRRREVELRRIAAALKRIEEDDYGHCLNCDELIASGRLEIDPAATLCIKCAE